MAREVVQAEDIVDYTRNENLAERFAKRFCDIAERFYRGIRGTAFNSTEHGLTHAAFFGEHRLAHPRLLASLTHFASDADRSGFERGPTPYFANEEVILSTPALTGNKQQYRLVELEPVRPQHLA